MSLNENEKLPYYYRYTSSDFLSNISLGARRRIFDLFVKFFAPTPDLRVIDIGFSSDMSRAESNFFEKMYPYKKSITAVAIEDVSAVAVHFPGIHFVRMNPGEPFPFKDKEFDLLFCNAVLEHVGDTEHQRKFLSELTRISKRGLIATPDRNFPIEHHTCIPFLHWLPKPLMWRIYGFLGYKELSSVENLNLLRKSDLKSLFGADQNVVVEKVWTFGFSSNLVALFNREI